VGGSAGLCAGSSTFTGTDIASTISSDGKYFGGVLGPNGLIYFVPYNADNIGVLNPSSSSFTTINIASTISSDGKYYTWRSARPQRPHLLCAFQSRQHYDWRTQPFLFLVYHDQHRQHHLFGLEVRWRSARPQRPHLLCPSKCRQHWQASYWQHTACVRGGRRRAGGMELFVISSLQQVLRFSKKFSKRLMETHHIFFEIYH